jgi:NADPH-dependent glutamate synthase beta subunit-like oxidoreductase
MDASDRLRAKANKTIYTNIINVAAAAQPAADCLQCNKVRCVLKFPTYEQKQQYKEGSKELCGC